MPAISPPSSEPTSAQLEPVLAALERIEQRLAAVERVAQSIAPTAQLTETVPGAVAMIVDTFDGVAAQLGERGVNLDERMRSVVRALEVATAPRSVDGLATLVASRLLDPAALAVLDQLAAALADAAPAPPVGAWGALRALRDPDVQRALGFMLGVARTLGQHLNGAELEAGRARLSSATTHLLEHP
ncbi:MAG: DUF1641 domain-containing protein [Kofleriaceae bacterium]